MGVVHVILDSYILTRSQALRGVPIPDIPGGLGGEQSLTVSHIEWHRLTSGRIRCGSVELRNRYEFV